MENAAWSGSGGSRLDYFFLCLHYRQSICPYFKFKKKITVDQFFSTQFKMFYFTIRFDGMSLGTFTQVLHFVFYFGVFMLFIYIYAITYIIYFDNFSS